MKLRRKNKTSIEVATSSMNDIMFFLMLFFLIMSTLLNPNVIKLSLPSSKHPSELRQKEVSLSVTKEMNYFINNRQVPFNQLEPELIAELRGVENATVVLRCDNSLSVQSLVDVLEIGNKLRIKMILATKASNGPQN
ncbi:MAG: biopolymer transporter ExbD [Bacteroidetes bacterium]|nr:biopolymer transporter ExbD [Bacteroidota bacterium]